MTFHKATVEVLQIHKVMPEGASSGRNGHRKHAIRLMELASSVVPLAQATLKGTKSQYTE